MPTFRRKILDFYFLASILWLLVSLIPSAFANSDPKESTPTITATIAETPSSSSDTTAPTVPILTAPPNGSVTNDNTPTFVWRQSSDPDGNTVTYILYINGVATYTGISNVGSSAGTGYTATIDGIEVKLTPTIALADAAYTWYVTANDNSGNTSQSTTWGFTIDTTAPPLTLTQLDNIANPTITEGANFDIQGPKNILFTVHSEPQTTIQITITSSSGEVWHLTSTTSSSGLTSLLQYLLPGIYTIEIVAIDLAGNTAALQSFTLTISQAQITVPLPQIPGFPGIPPSYEIPYSPFNFSGLTTLPATIARVATRSLLPALAIGLLALALLALLVYILNRKYNLILLNDQGHPLSEAKVYHSIPDTGDSITPVLMTTRDPISYSIRPTDRGRLYIRHLSRYSTLTVIVEGQTYILSISAPAKLYTIILG